MPIDLYMEAHLTVAALRVLEHRHTHPPSVDDVCEMLGYSLEKGNRICRKLTEMGIIDLIEGAYGTRLSVTDHLKIEEIPRGASDDRLNEELKKFQAERKQITQKVESIKAEQEEKKKSLFAELEKQLKTGVKNKG